MFSDEEALFSLLLNDELFVKRFIAEFAKGRTRLHARYNLGNAFRRFYERREFGWLLERHELGSIDTNLGEELDIFLELTLSPKGERLRDQMYSKVGAAAWEVISRKGWYHYADARLLGDEDISILRGGGVVDELTALGWYEFFLAANDVDHLELIRLNFPQFSKGTEVDADSVSLVRVVRDERLLEAIRRDPRRIFALNPRQFEEFTFELLVSLGYKDVRLGQGSKDGGVDVSAYIEHALGVERIIVQCKRHVLENKVGEPVVKQLLADTEINRAARGLLITTSYLTLPASLLVKTYEHRLGAIDHDKLIQLLKQGGGATWGSS